MTLPPARRSPPDAGLRLDDLLFALVLTTLATIAGLSASAVSRPQAASASSATAELPRVEVSVHRQAVPPAAVRDGRG